MNVHGHLYSVAESLSLHVKIGDRYDVGFEAAVIVEKASRP